MNIVALLALPLAPLLIAAGAAEGQLQVELSGLRSTKGVLLLCLSASPKHFPDCGADPAARRLSVRADRTAALRFVDLPPADYALSVIHDENGNAKLDTVMGIPREGFGFSRNPVVRFGPPRFGDVTFAMPAHAMTLPIKMRYFL